MEKKGRKIKNFSIASDFSKTLERYNEKIDLYSWANKYRTMPRGTSALTGLFSVDYVPPAIEIYKTFDTCNDLTLMMPTQMLKTEFIINAILYIFHKDPSPVILLEPSEDLTKEIAVQRIIPSLRSCEPLSKLSQLTTAYGIATHKKRENTEVISLANGATIFFNTPQQKGGVISKPIRFAFYDEIDRSDKDVSQLLRDRLNTYGNKSKFIDCSSPTEESQSIIYHRWKNGSAGTYKILCPNCNQLSTPDLSSLIAREGTAYIQCHECKGLISENQRSDAVKNGMYVHEKPDSQHRSFTATQLCSPFVSIQKVYNSQQIAIAETKRTGDDMYMQNFIQSNFAQPFSRKITLDDSLYSLALFDSGDSEVPAETLVITAAIDVQANRLECEICAWSLDADRISCHGLKYFTVMSNRRFATNKKGEEIEIYDKPSSKQFGEAVRVIHDSWKIKGTTNDRLPVSRVAVDCGYETELVRTACDSINSTLRGVCWIPVKGQSSTSQQMIKIIEDKNRDTRYSRTKSSIYNNVIYTDSHKATIYAQLEHDRKSSDFKYFTWNTNPSAGYCEDEKLKKDYLEGLYSETLATKKGSRKKYYTKIDDSIRNEPLDLKVYNLASLYFLARDKKVHDPIELLRKVSEMIASSKR